MISPIIFGEDNNYLCQIPSPSEIKETIFGIQNLKSPGPDGPALFYKSYWHIVGDSVIKAIQSFFVFGHMLTEVNNSLIVLIPKTNAPSVVNHYRPISLCNVVYKQSPKSWRTSCALCWTK